MKPKKSNAMERAVQANEPSRLVYFRTFIPAEAAEAKRNEIQILPFGTVSCVDGRCIKVDEEDIKLVLGDLATRKNPVAVLYEHGAGPRGGLAGGWVTDHAASSKDAPERKGLFGMSEWTDQAREEIKKKEWRFLSPGFFGVYEEDPDDSDSLFLRPRVLVEVSLTNVPAIDGMLPVAAELVLPSETPNAPKSDSAKEKTDMEKLNADALEAKVNEGLEKIKAATDEIATQKLAIAESKADLDSKLASFEAAVDEKAKKLAAEMATQTRNESKVADLTTRATKLGLVTDDTKEGFALLVKASPEAVEKLIERHEAVRRAPVGQLFQPSAPKNEAEKSKSEILTAATRLADATGITVPEAVRQVEASAS